MLPLHIRQALSRQMMDFERPHDFDFVVGMEPCGRFGIDTRQFTVQKIAALRAGLLQQRFSIGLICARGITQSVNQRPHVQSCATDDQRQPAGSIQPLNLLQRQPAILPGVKRLVGID